MIEAKICSLHAQCSLYGLTRAAGGKGELTEAQVQELFVEATRLDNMQPGVPLSPHSLLLVARIRRA